MKKDMNCGISNTYRIVIMCRWIIKGLTFLLVVVCSTSNLFASPDVNPNDPIMGLPLNAYESLEVLRATGCMPTFIHGDSIKTEREIAFLLAESSECIHEKGEGEFKTSSLVRKVWKKMWEQYRREYDLVKKNPKGKHNWKSLSFRKPIINLTALGYKEDGWTIPSSRINAYSSPWSAYKDGYHFKSGFNLLLWTKAALSLGSWFDMAAEPFFLYSTPSRQRFNLHSGNIKLTGGNFEFKIARTPLYWGQGREGRVLFSGNGEPVDLIQIGNPYPYKIFKTGAISYRVFWGAIHDDQFFDYSFLLAGRVMIKPVRTLELGFTRVVLFGGSGAPDFSFWDPVAELIGFRPQDGFIFNIPFKKGARSGGAGMANNLTSIDIRWRIPPLRNTEIFLEVFTEDPQISSDFIMDDGIFHGGIWIPRLNRKGDWQMFVEAAYSARIVYTHTVFKSGFTNGRRIMGMDTGPANVSGQLQLIKIFNSRARLWGAFGYQNYFDPATYDLLSVTNPRDEQRFIFRLGSNLLVNDHLRLNFEGGLQYIKNFNFSANNRKSYFGQLDLQYQF